MAWRALGPKCYRLLGEAFDAGTEHGHLALDAAGRAFHRDGLCGAALVADEAAAEAMFDHTRVAGVAADLMATGAADRQWRVAATVQEEQRLFAGGEAFGDRLCQRVGDPAAGLQIGRPQVDRRHVRQTCDAEAFGQVEARVFAGVGVGPAFEARGGGGEHHGGALDRGAQHRHVAGVIEHAVLLLVGAVVLLVDNDEAELAERQEQRRARAHHQPGVAGGDGMPGAAAVGLGHAGVPFGRAGAEPRLDPVEKLHREGDLGQKDQGLPPGAQGFGDGFEIDLGLARSGHALRAAWWNSRRGGRRRAVCRRRAPDPPTACAAALRGRARGTAGRAGRCRAGSRPAPPAPSAPRRIHPRDARVRPGRSLGFHTPRKPPSPGAAPRSCAPAPGRSGAAAAARRAARRGRARGWRGAAYG